MFRPSTGTWFTLPSSTGFAVPGGIHAGRKQRRALAGDFDGDGKTTRRPLRRRRDLVDPPPTPGAIQFQWLERRPAGSRRLRRRRQTDVAVYRPGTGVWYVRQSSTNFAASVSFQWGLPNDVVAPGDYDGDGVTDLAVWRPSSGVWFIRLSTTAYASSASFQWGGLSGDISVPGDFDGDGKTDLAVYRPSSGTWFIRQSTTNYATSVTYQWGLTNDIPVPGDFDGDGKIDVAVFRPSTSTWFLLMSSTTSPRPQSLQWGLSGDDRFSSAHHPAANRHHDDPTSVPGGRPPRSH